MFIREWAVHLELAWTAMVLLASPGSRTVWLPKSQYAI
jgi:hypothetical protein